MFTTTDFHRWFNMNRLLLLILQIHYGDLHKGVRETCLGVRNLFDVWVRLTLRSVERVTEEGDQGGVERYVGHVARG